MQDLEIVIVNFHPEKPIFTEAVFEDPEVRSVRAEREAAARALRREARRRNRRAQRRANAANGGNNNSSSGRNQQQNEDLESSDESADEANHSNGNQNSGRNGATGNQVRSVNVMGDEVTVVSLPVRGSNRRTTLSRARHILSAPLSRRGRTQSPNTLNVPPANPNRYHPDLAEEIWLSPEPSPVPSRVSSPIHSPIHSPVHSPALSPVVKRAGKKWKENALHLPHGCNTCRGDLAILSRHRPQIQKDTFVKVTISFVVLC